MHDLGYLESGLTGSLVQLAICDGMVAWLRHLKAPLDTSDEALALDLIDEVGPDGQFLAARHTTKHYRELYYPTLFERATREAWTASGGTTLAERAGRRVEELLEGAPPPAPPECDDGLAAIVAEAERRLTAR